VVRGISNVEEEAVLNVKSKTPVLITRTMRWAVESMLVLERAL
jgi:hypothetical protein